MVAFLCLAMTSPVGERDRFFCITAILGEVEMSEIADLLERDALPPPHADSHPGKVPAGFILSNLNSLIAAVSFNDECLAIYTNIGTLQNFTLHNITMYCVYASAVPMYCTYIFSVQYV